LHCDLQNEHAIVGNNVGLLLMLHYGTDVQKAAWVDDLAEGRRHFAFGITEPRHGSDATHMETTAILDGGQWVINGEKTWNTGVHVAQYDLILAPTASTSPSGTRWNASRSANHSPPTSRHKPFEHIYRHHRRYRITEGSEEIQMRRVAGYIFGYMKQQAPKGVSGTPPMPTRSAGPGPPAPGHPAGLAGLAGLDVAAAAARTPTTPAHSAAPETTSWAPDGAVTALLPVQGAHDRIPASS
jgi:hypothetical protein